MTRRKRRNDLAADADTMTNSGNRTVTPESGVPQTLEPPQLVHWMQGMGSAPIILQAPAKEDLIKVQGAQKPVEADANLAARKLTFSVESHEGKVTLADVWEPYFDISKETNRIVPTWVILPGLPIQYWTTENLGRIASYLGKPVCTDKLTAQGDRISYARILVDIDISQPLPEHVLIEDEKGGFKEQRLEYEWKPSYCQDCLQIGHTTGNCKKEQEPADKPEKGEKKNHKGRRQKQKKQPTSQWKVKTNLPKPLEQEGQQNEEVNVKADDKVDTDEQGRIVKGKMEVVPHRSESQEGVMTYAEVEKLLSQNRFSSLRIQTKETTNEVEKATSTYDKFPP
ncbi:hypothetical protein A4A49_14207 [Nicotiana attenuata]|uniref:Uncharacterized protein n=1 Tax=Nicotiana attenuata TaxID=49451 RepID=A0A314LCG6_NICAT|nr:hypothetical protein A4A49_14207 [Nicotiana attenuata]